MYPVLSIAHPGRFGTLQVLRRGITRIASCGRTAWKRLQRQLFSAGLLHVMSLVSSFFKAPLDPFKELPRLAQERCAVRKPSFPSFSRMKPNPPIGEHIL